MSLNIPIRDYNMFLHMHVLSKYPKHLIEYTPIKLYTVILQKKIF